MLRWSSGRLVDGLWVGTFESDPNILPRVEDALRLIKQHDPLRYSRLIRDLERVWVRLLPGSHGCFNESLAACELDPRYVLAEVSTPDIVASTIVHEATHARLWWSGIGYNEEVRQRVEAVCLRRELAFAARLPDGERVRENAEAWLHTPREDLNNTAFAERELEGNIETGRYLGIPEWLIRTILAVRTGIWRPTHWMRAAARWYRSAGRLDSPAKGEEHGDPL